MDSETPNQNHAVRGLHVLLLSVKYANTLVSKRPYVVALLTCAGYLFVFQNNFITSGDAWAESYAEYLDRALRLGWTEVFAQNWAGYFAIIPNLLTSAFVSIVGNIAYVDYYFRGTSILFALCSASLISLKYFRELIRQDYLRILLSLLLVAMLPDIASFSFINIWYMGFVPVLAYSLTPTRASPRLDVFMGIYGGLVALTKPFLILPIFLLYRILKTRQFFGPLLILIASIIQSSQILLFDSRNIVQQTNLQPITIIEGMIAGTATTLLKLLQVTYAQPALLWLAGLYVLLPFLMIIRYKKPVLAILLGAAFLFAMITYILAPDGSAYFGFEHINKTLEYTYKSQREILVNGVYALTLFIALSYILLNTVRPRFKYVLVGCVILLTFSYCAVVNPIDTRSGGVVGGVAAFRQQLSDGKPSCVPLAPNALYIDSANWSFGYKGVCETLTHDRNIYNPDFENFKIPASGQRIIYDAKNAGLQNDSLSAVTIPLVNNSGSGCIVTLAPMNQEKSATSYAILKARDGVQMLTFNVGSIPPSSNHQLLLGSTCPTDIFAASFMGKRYIVTYPYFIRTY